MVPFSPKNSSNSTKNLRSYSIQIFSGPSKIIKTARGVPLLTSAEIFERYRRIKSPTDQLNGTF